MRTLGSTDPVALHQENFLRPLTFELLHVFEKTIGVVGDSQVPLSEFFLGDSGVAPFALTCDHLLISQNCLAVGAPIDCTELAIGQTALKHLQEEPLVPAVVTRVAGVQDSVPVK